MIGFGDLNDILEPHATQFWRLKSGVASKQLRGTIADTGTLSFTVSTDNNGYRRGPPLADAQATVLFLGDSCTFGVGVDDDETFAALLQERLQVVRCRNGGVPGYSAYQGRLLLESYPYAPPDIVVVSFLFNDNSPWDQLSDLQHGIIYQSISARLVRYSRFASLLAKLKPRRITTASTTQPTRPRLTDGEYATQLRQIVARCTELGSRPIFLVWPLRSQMSGGATIVKQDVMRYVASQHGIASVDLVSEFRAWGGKQLFADLVHANEAGNRLIADLLEPRIRSELGRAQ